MRWFEKDMGVLLVFVLAVEEKEIKIVYVSTYKWME